MIKDFIIETEDLAPTEDSSSWAFVIDNAEDGGEVFSLYRNAGHMWEFWCDFYDVNKAMLITKWLREYVGYSYSLTAEFPEISTLKTMI